MLELSIIILNYKQKGLVKQCVRGILTSQPDLDYEIIVVDNNSNDGCLAAVEQLFSDFKSVTGTTTASFITTKLPKLITIQSDNNGGFAVGNNLGLAKAQGQYLLVLNPDIAIIPGVLEKMVNFMKQNSRVGVVSPKLINPDGSVQLSCRRFPDWRLPFYKRSVLGKLSWGRAATAKYLMVDFNHTETTAVDWLFGACLMLRRELVEKIGMFDQRFFMYFEDLDLCRRAWHAGFYVYYFTAAEVVHYHQRLSAQRAGIFGLLKPAGRIHLMSGIKYFAKYLGVPVPKTSGLDKIVIFK